MLQDSNIVCSLCSVPKLKNVFFRAFYILLAVVLFLVQASLCHAQSSHYSKHAKEIKNLLNDHKVDKALQRLQQLVDKYPNDEYYAELQLSILQQVIEKIKIAQEGFYPIYSDDEDSNAAIPSHLSISPKIGATDSSATETEDIAFDDLVIDTLNMPQDNAAPVLTKRQQRQRARRIKKLQREFELAEEAGNVTVTIDSTIIKDHLQSAAAKKEDPKVEVLNSPAHHSEPNFGDVKLSRAAKKQKAIFDFYAAKDLRYYEKMLLDAARAMTLRTQNCDSAFSFLYTNYIDTLDRVTTYNDAAIAKLEEGDEHLLLMNYEAALRAYNDAMVLEPEYYEAYLHMARAYDKLRDDSMAIEYYNTAIQMRPQCTRAYFELANYFYKRGEFQQSLDFTLICILLYPERKFFNMLKSIAQQNAKEFNSQWIPRDVFPILPGNDIDEIIVDERSPWYHYQQAKKDFGVYADEGGIMRSNELSGEQYLETNAWLCMLDSVKDTTKFAFARHMRNIGYLDCYVLISLFHHDLYTQFKHLVKNKPQKVRAYMRMLSEWDSKKYDRLRSVKAPPTRSGNDEHNDGVNDTDQNEQTHTQTTRRKPSKKKK